MTKRTRLSASTPLLLCLRYFCLLRRALSRLVLVTGASGCVGSANTLELLYMGVSVRLTLRKQGQVDAWKAEHGATDCDRIHIWPSQPTKRRMASLTTRY